MGRMRRVHTPRQTFGAVRAFARWLGVSHAALLQSPYFDYTDDDDYVLRPLDEAAYQRWHAVVYARAQREKGCA